LKTINAHTDSTRTGIIHFSTLDNIYLVSCMQIDRIIKLTGQPYDNLIKCGKHSINKSG
jgi:hypothetical protein